MGATVTFLTTVIGAIVGGLIAGYFSSKATKDAHANQKSISQENETQIIRSLMQALHDELETIFDNYQETLVTGQACYKQPYHRIYQFW